MHQMNHSYGSSTPPHRQRPGAGHARFTSSGQAPMIALILVTTLAFVIGL